MTERPTTSLSTTEPPARRPRPKTYADAEAERQYWMQRARLLRWAWSKLFREFREEHADANRGHLLDERGRPFRPYRHIVDEVLGELLVLATEASDRAREIDRMRVR